MVKTAVAASEEVTRLTVNFNTMAMTTEKIRFRRSLCLGSDIW